QVGNPGQRGFSLDGNRAVLGEDVGESLVGPELEVVAVRGFLILTSAGVALEDQIDPTPLRARRVLDQPPNGEGSGCRCQARLFVGEAVGSVPDPFSLLLDV